MSLRASVGTDRGKAVGTAPVAAVGARAEANKKYQHCLKDIKTSETTKQQIYLSRLLNIVLK